MGVTFLDGSWLAMGIISVPMSLTLTDLTADMVVPSIGLLIHQIDSSQSTFFVTTCIEVPLEHNFHFFVQLHHLHCWSNLAPSAEQELSSTCHLRWSPRLGLRLVLLSTS
ncbi:hypothetical protein SLEP1_g25540 [Rubroshorea leprosula]|uniref:Uncharacterized protein n=1 Tax=Rubroshorea leprosula TaxID=152421 RepID=A0AAV5JJ38_9ROSI|nr:hypothetical protein SLEP1_g25540 [Rubroshorea leprosula]